MPENIDAVHVEDREFILAGETFKWRKIHWREQLAWIDEAVGRQEKEKQEREEREERARTQAEAEGREYEEVLAELDDRESETIIQSYEKVVDRILLYLDADHRERFLATVNNPDKEVTVHQLNELRDWLQEIQNRRPTQPSSDSDVGPGRTVRISQAA